MNVKYNLLMIVLLNMIPLIGFWYFDWSMFSIVYIYWAEGLIVAVFECAKIAIAFGREENKPKVDHFFTRLSSALKFLMVKIGILLFYGIFIFAFVANPPGETNRDIVTHNYLILFFQDKWFNSALIAYFASQFIFFMTSFIATDDYKNKASSSYKVLFDGRTIVLHIVIVLGTFGYQYFKRFESIDNRLPALSYVLLLVVIKTFSDILRYKFSLISKSG